MSATPPGRQRDLRRLALAAGLVVIVAVSFDLNAGMAVAFALAVMEVDARTS